MRRGRASSGGARAHRSSDRTRACGALRSPLHGVVAPRCKPTPLPLLPRSSTGGAQAVDSWRPEAPGAPQHARPQGGGVGADGAHRRSTQGAVGAARWQLHARTSRRRRPQRAARVGNAHPSVAWPAMAAPPLPLQAAARCARKAAAHTEHEPPTPTETQVAEEVLACAPTDDSVFHTLTYVLRPTGRLGDLTAAYEKAVAKAPQSSELLTGLFGCYVRWGAFGGRAFADAVCRGIGGLDMATPEQCAPFICSLLRIPACRDPCRDPCHGTSEAEFICPIILTPPGISASSSSSRRP